MKPIKYIEATILGTVIALVIVEMVCCCINKDFMWFQNMATTEAAIEFEEVSTEETETAEIIVFEVETATPPTVKAVELTRTEVCESTSTEAETETVEETEIYLPHYTVNGYDLDPALYEYLRMQLSSNGIEWFLPYALCEAYQESNFNIYALNRNGLDMGLFQYRVTFWDWSAGDIWDPYAQIRVYARTMAGRIQSGESVEQAISDHYTGGFGYSEEYVGDVLGWMETLKDTNKEGKQ